MKPIGPSTKRSLNALVFVGIAWNILKTGRVLHVRGDFKVLRNILYSSYECGLLDKLLERNVPSCPSGLLVDMLMPPDRAEEALVNIFGRYQYWVDKHGRHKARIIFAMQSIGCVITFWADWAMKRLGLLNLVRRS
jgi:hypothetical protein